MTDNTHTDIPSVADRTLPVQAEGAVVGVHFLGDTAAFVLGEEALLLASPKGDTRRVAVHGGAILCSASDGDRIVTGGDDGKVVSANAKGEIAVIAANEKGAWTDHAAIAPNG